MTEPTTCKFPALPKTVKTYKSQRAAKIAATKAEQAYEIALRNSGTDEYRSGTVITLCEDGTVTSNDDLHERVREYTSKAFDNLAATIAAIKSQGFYASSWYVGSNATRDLIAANMD